MPAQAGTPASHQRQSLPESWRRKGPRLNTATRVPGRLPPGGGRSQRLQRCGCPGPQAAADRSDFSAADASYRARPSLASTAGGARPHVHSAVCQLLWPPVECPALLQGPSLPRHCQRPRLGRSGPAAATAALSRGRAACSGGCSTAARHFTTAHDSGGRSVAAMAHAQLIASGVRARHRRTTGTTTRNDAAAAAGGRVQPRSAQEARCKNGGGHSRAPRLKKWGGGTARALPAGGEAKGTAVRHHGR